MLWLTMGLTVYGYPLNVAISLYLFENPCKSWKKILKEKTLSVSWDLSWMFVLLAFSLICFSSQFRRLFGSFVDFLFVRYFEEKTKIFQWIMWLYLFFETILMIWTFISLISNTYWNKFWCYSDIWVGFKESKQNFPYFIW